MTKINFICDFIGGTTGIARHGRSLFAALYQEVETIHLETKQGPQWERYVNEAELNAITTPATSDMVSVCIHNPPAWPFYYTDPCKAFYGFVVWEGTKIPLFWKEYIENPRVTGVFVPSQHVKDAILNTYKCKKPIFVIPHGVNNAVFTRNLEVDNKLRPFTFVYCKGWNFHEKDRGGVPIAVRAFSEEFTKDDNVRFILKLNPAYMPQDDKLLTEAFDKLCLPEGRNRINVVYRNMTDEEIANIFSESDVIVSASYAEGFNIPLLEGMSCGCVPLVPNFGGHLDFCNKKNSYIINKGKFVKPYDMLYENVEWFETDSKALGKKMRWIYNNKLNLVKKVELCELTASKFSWHNSAKQLLKSIE